MSSVNTPLSMRHTNGTMRNGRGLLSATKTYTESLFSEKRGRKFLSFFSLFLKKSKITPAMAAISRSSLWCGCKWKRRRCSLPLCSLSTRDRRTVYRNSLFHAIF